MAGEPARATRACARVRRRACRGRSTLSSRAPSASGLQPLPASLAARWREAASILAGKTKPYHAVVNQLCVPRLPAIPFFERELVPVSRGARGEDRRHSRRARSGARCGSRPVRPVHPVRAGPAGEPVARAQPLAPLEHAALVAQRQARRREPRALPRDGARARCAAARRHRRAVPERDVLGARAEDAHSAAQRRNERARRRALAAHRPGSAAATASASMAALASRRDA